MKEIPWKKLKRFFSIFAQHFLSLFQHMAEKNREQWYVQEHVENEEVVVIEHEIPRVRHWNSE